METGRGVGRNRYRKLTAADWTPECERSMGSLKDALLANVDLAHPEFSGPFVLSTDVSTDGLGAVLSQVAPGDDRAHPIAFASKSLIKTQSNYPAHRLEFMVLRWAVCEKFSHWLKGHTFTAWTDNNPLTHILTKPKLDACEQKKAAYDFDLKYVPGPKNVVADVLSREPFAGRSIGERLLQEPYEDLLHESAKLSDVEVQDAFRSSNVRPVCSEDQEKGRASTAAPSLSSVSSAEVSAILDSHVTWEAATRVRAIALASRVQSVTDIVKSSQMYLYNTYSYN